MPGPKKTAAPADATSVKKRPAKQAIAAAMTPDTVRLKRQIVSDEQTQNDELTSGTIGDTEISFLSPKGEAARKRKLARQDSLDAARKGLPSILGALRGRK